MPTRISSRTLFVSNGTQLPQFCVLTNEPVSRDEMVTETFFWAPKVHSTRLYRLLFGLRKGRACKITYGIKRSVRRKYRLKLPLKLTGCFFGSAFMLAAALFTIYIPKHLEPVLLIAGLLLVLFCGLSLPFRNRPLRIIDFTGEEFVVSGFSSDYMNRVTKS